MKLNRKIVNYSKWLNNIYNIAFVNSERWLAKSRVDITLCQHGKFPATLLLKFFVLYYERNIKHFFRIDIQLYQHSWKLEKLKIVWKHSALRASCFHTISRFSNFYSCWYNCITIHASKNIKFSLFSQPTRTSCLNKACFTLGYLLAFINLAKDILNDWQTHNI